MQEGFKLLYEEDVKELLETIGKELYINIVPENILKMCGNGWGIRASLIGLSLDAIIEMLCYIE